MHRIFVEDKLKVNTHLKINDEQSHHLFNVLRMNTGDTIEVVDTNKDLYIATLEKASKFIITSKEKATTEAFTDVTIFQGAPKKSKFEQVIKMGTEIGAKRFILVEMKRSVVKIKQDKVDKLVNRWERIVLSASKQSKRQEIPKIDSPIGFREMINRFNQFDLIICLYENEDETTLRDINLKSGSKIALIIGPEGGISSQEAKKIGDAGAVFCSLGPRIMRTETAGVVALSIILHLTGDL